MTKKDGRIRKHLCEGMTVQIILKQDQKSGYLTKGTIAEFLTNSAKHPHGIKVRLKNGKIGRVQKIIASHKDTHGRSGSHETTTQESPTRNKIGGHLKFLDY